MATINLNRSYVLVTGGAGGIGSAVCKLLPTIGMTPIIGFNTNGSQASDLAAQTAGFALRIDMGSEESVIQAIKTITDRLGDGDSLIGVILGASPPPDLLPFSSLRPTHLSHQLQVNVIGAQFLLSELIKQFFRKTKTGIIVGILSQAMGAENRAPVTGMGAYIIAKTALKSMLLVCAAEYPWLKVRTVSPGFTETEMLAVFDSRYLEMMRCQESFSTAESVAKIIIKEILL